MNALVSEKTFNNFLTKSIKNRPIRRYGSPTPTVWKIIKKLICNKRDQYYEAKIDEIDESIDQNNFWNLFKKSESPKSRPFLQCGTIWRSYFKTLYQQLEPDLNQPQTNTKRKLEELQKTIKITKTHWTWL